MPLLPPPFQRPPSVGPFAVAGRQPSLYCLFHILLTPSCRHPPLLVGFPAFLRHVAQRHIVSRRPHDVRGLLLTEGGLRAHHDVTAMTSCPRRPSMDACRDFRRDQDLSSSGVHVHLSTPSPYSLFLPLPLNGRHKPILYLG